MTDPLVSFIIPVRNDAARLQQSLKAIRQGERSTGAVEILVADNGSSDDSPLVARAMGARVLELPGLEVTGLRNRAVSEAEGILLAFCDADNVIGQEWLKRAQELFTDLEVVAVGALCHPPSPGTWVQQAYDGLRDHHSGTRGVRWLGAGNMVVRRSAFVAVGGFDETLATCEDVDLCKRLRDRGGKLLSDSRLYNTHLGDPETIWQVFKGELWRGQDSLRVTLRRPVSWQDLPSILIPILDLAFVVAMAVGLLVASVSGWVVFGLPGAGFIGLAALRCGRMLHQSRNLTWRQAHQILAVAATYDLGRALALVWPSGHHRNRER